MLETLPRLKDNQFCIQRDLKTKQVKWLEMLYYTFQNEQLTAAPTNLEGAFAYWFGKDAYFNELMAVLELTYNQLELVTQPIEGLGSEHPLELHGTYTMSMILTAIGKQKVDKRDSFREGVLYLPEQQTDVFFITLNKSESDYTETTLYDDYAINETLFHWQSQSRITDTSKTGQQYINQRTHKGKVLLFARAYKQEDGFTSLYTCLGLADYVSHKGSAPISVVWELRDGIPGRLLGVARKAE